MYDDLKIFNFKNLDKEAFSDGIIRISCYDAMGGKGMRILTSSF